MKYEIVNRTNFKKKDIKEIAEALMEGQLVPPFYLVCQTPHHDGLTITNIDKPIVIITIKDLGQFAEVFVHELEHLKQHSNGYSSEDFDSEIVVTDKFKKEGDTQ